MNVLFLSLLDMNSLADGNIYSDLLQVFANNGHKVYAVSPLERKHKKNTHVIEGENYKILRNKILNIQKTNLIEKGISTLQIEGKTKRAIKKYFKDVKFDLILYSTPPVTFAGVVKYFKKRDNAITYLLLKDIFPQNCVDLGLFSKKSIFHWFFKRKEQKLYALSDYIGCMSPANVEYLLKHNPQLDGKRVEVCPNSERLQDNSKSSEEKLAIREKYNLPKDKIIFCYGGNLGRPQNIDYLVECLRVADSKFHFLIVGGGTDAEKVRVYAESSENTTYLKFLPKQEYQNVLSCADVGLIILDKRFTIPNYPSRSLSYMKSRLPIYCVTDKNCDLGDVAEKYGFGVKQISDSVENFTKGLEKFTNISDNIIMGNNAYAYFEDNYDVEKVYPIIVEKCKGDRI